MANKTGLEGKVAIVTGASRGIGRATALALADGGAKVVIASRNKYGDLDEVAKELKALKKTVLAVPAHLGSNEALTNLIDKTKQEFGRIDILVNNAASNPLLSPLAELEERTWDQIMNINLKGSFLLAQKVAKLMMEQKSGCIVNIASIDGLRPANGLGTYSISKAGVIMLTQALARELGFKKEPPVVVGGNDAVLAAFSFGCAGPSKEAKVKCPKCGAVFTIDEGLKTIGP